MPGVNAFDKNVDRYEQWFVDNPLAYVSELRALRELLPTSGKGIEIGVGTGRFAAPLGIRNGIEPSRSMAEVARKRGIEVVHGVAEHLPFADREFDHALMVTTVCFLDDVNMAFQEVRRVLKTGGAFVIGFVDRESPLGMAYQDRKDKSAFYQDATFYSVDQIISSMQKNGFGAFTFRQTLFRPLPELEEVEPVKQGHGEGSFVVVRGEKQ
jgi:ubiquinone/menaquinone biosynthesis C-methylase UbiE